MSALQAVLFDLDGTISDSLGALHKAYSKFTEKIGVRGNEDEFESLNGPPLREIVDYFRVTYRLQKSPDDLLQIYNSIIEVEMQAVAPMAGAIQLFNALRDQQRAIGVVTSSSSEAAHQWLKRHDLREHVDVLVGGNDILAGKPNPEPYQFALARLNRFASDAVAVEDSPAGATSARSAGLKTFVLNKQPSKFEWPEEVIFIEKLLDLREVLHA